jgi:hypothetical protein
VLGGLAVLLPAMASSQTKGAAAPVAAVVTAPATLSAEVEHVIRSGPDPQITFIDLDAGRALPPPFPIRLNDLMADNPPLQPFDMTPAIERWIDENNISLVVVTSAAKDEDRIHVSDIRTRVLTSNRGDGNLETRYTGTTAEFLSTLFAATPVEAGKMLGHPADWQAPDAPDPYTSVNRYGTRLLAVPMTVFFRTRAGTTGVLQYRGQRAGDTFPQALSVRYKRIAPAATQPK